MIDAPHNWDGREHRDVTSRSLNNFFHFVYFCNYKSQLVCVYVVNLNRRFASWWEKFCFVVAHLSETTVTLPRNSLCAHARGHAVDTYVWVGREGGKWGDILQKFLEFENNIYVLGRTSLLISGFQKPILRS